MKLYEICGLKESVTFGVAEFIDDPKHGKFFSGTKWEKQIDKECWVCDGTGKESHSGDSSECGMCKGKGKLKGTEAEYPELNVSNTNAVAIIDFLGLKWNDAGSFEPKDLPVLRRKLIKLKNGDLTDLTTDTVHSQEPMRIRKSDGMSSISRGPKEIEIGRSAEQVQRYADQLLAIIDFAQKNSAHVTWA